MYVEIVIFVSLSYKAELYNELGAPSAPSSNEELKKKYVCGSASFPAEFLNSLTFCVVKSCTSNPAKGKCFGSEKESLRPMVSCSYDKYIQKAQQNEQHLPTLKPTRTKIAAA